MKNETAVPSLVAAIAALSAKVRRFDGKPLGEQNTKATLIEPMLEALGWDIRDPDEVYREFKPTTKDCPVDYALQLLRKPRLFVEAKGLHENLSDRKWIAQVLGYATVAGVEWCVLTDGDEYRFYNATAAVDAEEKLFCSLRLSEAAESDAAKTLALISRNNMADNLIDVLWSAHFVDRRVKAALNALFTTADRGLVRLVRRFEPKLKPRQVAESIRRLDIEITSSAAPGDSPQAAAGAESARSAGARKASETQRGKLRRSPKHAAKSGDGERSASEPETGRAFLGVSLRDLIDAGLIKPPLKLTREYKGHLLEAEIRADGTVVFQGKPYPSCSAAADEARRTVVGGTPHTNGWAFWLIQSGGGQPVPVDSVRQAFLNQSHK